LDLWIIASSESRLLGDVGLSGCQNLIIFDRIYGDQELRTKQMG
jgi:hypothetical protein